MLHRTTRFGATAKSANPSRSLTMPSDKAFGKVKERPELFLAGGFSAHKAVRIIMPLVKDQQLFNWLKMNRWSYPATL